MPSAPTLDPVSDVDLDEVRQRFAASEDLTLGIEEEYMLLDPDTHDLVPRFDDLASSATGLLAEAISGELIRSEIEIRTGANPDFAAAVADLEERRLLLADHAAAHGVALGRAGTHPFADWREQQVIDTEHYRRVEGELGYVAWRNNTFAVHLHVGVRGGDRAVALCDRLRGDLPTLLALSASSPWAEGRVTRLHSTRTQLFTKNFPRCGITEPFGSWAAYAAFVDLLVRTQSIVESTQIWWSIRPHHRFGTVEFRICDAQMRGDEQVDLCGLMLALAATTLRDIDEGRPHDDPSSRLLDENLWRAERDGLDGRLIDLDRLEATPTVAVVERMLDRVEPMAAELGLTGHLDGIAHMLAEGNGAQRAIRRLEGGEDLRSVFADLVVAETFATTPRETTR